MLSLCSRCPWQQSNFVHRPDVAPLHTNSELGTIKLPLSNELFFLEPRFPEPTSNEISEVSESESLVLFQFLFQVLLPVLIHHYFCLLDGEQNIFIAHPGNKANSDSMRD